MKKQFIISALVFVAAIFGAQNAMAQSPIQATTSTTIKIELSDVISISDESIAAGGRVDFIYNSIAEYNSTKTANVPKSLIVSSTRPFDVKVKANGKNFELESGTASIPVNVVTIKPVKGGNMGGTPKDVTLSTSDQTLISGAPIGNGVLLDLEYEIPKERSSSSDIFGKPSGNYVQTITYTATAN